MGIPAFYRWLVERYPLAVVDVLEECPNTINGVQIPIDTSKPNPNGVEFDNLYLDMNGIIHPCFHPENGPAPQSYEEVFKSVFRYIDRIFTIIRPRKLLYMAIDGVAPRAKMNQQRTRRFRAAKDAADAAVEEECRRNEVQSEEEILAALDQTTKLDSNVITPGTEFMALLSTALQYYIHLRINSDPGWLGIKVILSDANVPGEGEHKIMSYIRLQRNLPGCDPNTRHCLYGLDADLIMLALATHEIHFAILREDIRKAQMDNEAKRRKRPGRGQQKPKPSDSEDLSDHIAEQQFQFLNVWVIREYLMHDLQIPNSEVKADLERLIDDFVFMCVFVGNDFLPHVPSLEISEGAIDLLVNVYKNEFVRMGGHLTNSHEVHLERVEHFLQVVGSYENATFRRRSQVTKDRNNLFKNHSNIIKHGSKSSDKPKKQPKDFWSSTDLIAEPACPASGNSDSEEGKRLADSMKSDGSIAVTGDANGKKIQYPIIGSLTTDATIEVADNIKLGEEGWKERYYSEKFETKSKQEIEEIRELAVLKYIEGICWVMHYYYEGVCSWQWCEEMPTPRGENRPPRFKAYGSTEFYNRFYPYHYAPFASDFHGLNRLEIHFALGEPFKPLDQLMAVLPAASAHALPRYYRKLMTDSTSPILDFYPEDFELDMNGKRFAWQAICKLPFIKESRLLEEIAKVEHSLTDEEKRRNSLGLDVLVIHISHPLAEKVFEFCKKMKDHPKLHMAKVKRKINPKYSGGMNGYMYISNEPVWKPEITSPIEDMETITENKVISFFYNFPSFHPHIPRPPEGVVVPRKLVSKRDILPSAVLWHDKFSIFGRVYSQRPVPNSVGGPSLTKLAHQLILHYYQDKKQQLEARMDVTTADASLSEKKLGIRAPVNVRKKITGTAKTEHNSETTKRDNHVPDVSSCKTDSKKIVSREIVENDEREHTGAGMQHKRSSKKTKEKGEGRQDSSKKEIKGNGVGTREEVDVHADDTTGTVPSETPSKTIVGTKIKEIDEGPQVGESMELGGQASTMDSSPCKTPSQIRGNAKRSYSGSRKEKRKRSVQVDDEPQSIKKKKQPKETTPLA